MAKKITDNYIKDFFCLSDTPEGKAELKEIKSKLTEIVFENGTDICTIDGAPDGMFFLESGMAVVLSRDNEQINVMHRGQYFGEYAVLTGSSRLCTVRALGKCIVYKLESDEMKAFLEKHPRIYGELIKRVYGQVSRKHSQILALSSIHKGIMQHPANKTPLSKRQVAINYGVLALIFIFAARLIPIGTTAPVFIIPLVFMLVYMIMSKRTLETLIASVMLSAIIVNRTGISASFADAFMETMGDPDNVFTVLVMALIGGVVTLIEASGGITAFRNFAEKKGTTPRRIMLLSCFIMAITSIDEGLNMRCASFASYNSAREKGIIREKLALLYSLLPTVLCSFFPLSLWGIFVIGTLSTSTKENAVGLFCRSIPYNFFSFFTVIVILLFASDRMYKSKLIKEGEARYANGGALWPSGSERYLNIGGSEVWGEISNVMLPIAVLAVSSLAVRSLRNMSFVVDSAVGLIITLIFMFILYCAKGLMNPEEYLDRMIDGISSTTLPIIMYLLNMCFYTMLERCNLSEYFEAGIDLFIRFKPIMPVVVFIMCTLLSMALGSSWAMYAIAFPLILSLTRTIGLNPAMFTGIMAGAGIAGEQICMYTSNSIDVGSAIGCNPDTVFKIRITYSLAIAIASAIGYLLMGLFI